MIGLTIINLLGLPVGFGIMALAVMATDAGVNWFLQALALVALALPVSMVVGSTGAWISWRLHQRRWAWWWITLPWQLLLVLVIMVGLAVVTSVEVVAAR